MRAKRRDRHIGEIFKKLFKKWAFSGSKLKLEPSPI